MCPVEAADPVDRFWPKVDKDGPVAEHMSTPCWVWTAGKFHDGYGKFFLGPGSGKCVAHRFAYQSEIGEIPDDTLVLHRCDRRSCVRPDHLYLGSVHEKSAHTAERRHGNRGVGLDWRVIEDGILRELSVCAKSVRQLSESLGTSIPSTATRLSAMASDGAIAFVRRPRDGKKLWHLIATAAPKTKTTTPTRGPSAGA